MRYLLVAIALLLGLIWLIPGEPCRATFAGHCLTEPIG